MNDNQKFTIASVGEMVESIAKAYDGRQHPEKHFEIGTSLILSLGAAGFVISHNPIEAMATVAVIKTLAEAGGSTLAVMGEGDDVNIERDFGDGGLQANAPGVGTKQ